MPHERQFHETTVVNKRQQDYDVYIGRPTKWGNPWTHISSSLKGVTTVSSRDEAIATYRFWINQPEQKAFRNEVRDKLRGKILGCFCKPLDCHGDILAEIADSKYEE